MSDERKVVLKMLGYWRSHADYHQFVVSKLSRFAKDNPTAIFEYETEIAKLYILDLDPMKHIIAPLYSTTGRPSHFQPEIFRVMILMQCLKIPPDNWVSKLKNNFVLRTICGFDEHIPAIASYYDFINRIVKLDEKPRYKRKKRKPKKKIGKNKKLPNKRVGIVDRIVKRIIAGRRLNARPERILQQIFADVCVAKSVELGLVPKTVSVSGDGTCIKTGASSYGVKTCDCKKRGDYHCDCPRRFSDPNATWGWDSSKEQWFYGYTGYFISTYNKDLHLDLPLYLRLVEASRHDSVSAVVAIAEFRDLCPDLKIDTFISDSASDNYATYELLHKWKINAVIALNNTNKGNLKYQPKNGIDTDGVPICAGGYRMINWGFNGNDRCRIKWRCPTACGYFAEDCVNCSPSNYGRVIYTKPEWDLRLFTRIPRGSNTWKSKMKERTAAERVNNRILNHYGVENSHTRSKKRISFFCTLAAFNIHLDAQLDYLKSVSSFSLSDLFVI